MLKFLVGGLVLIGCAAAFAQDGGGQRPAGERLTAKRSGRPPATPRITAHPARVTLSSAASFAFRPRHGRGHRFVCRVDRRPARRCRSPIRIRGLRLGRHRFSVATVTRAGRRGRAAGFRWQVVEPSPLDVTAHMNGLPALYPGAPPSQVPLTITNPNREAIWVVSLRASAAASPPGCDAAENLTITASSVSESSPLVVPPHASVEVPAAGVAAPAIELRNLATNQDACQGGRFELRFEGTAHG